jgi:hypothetical protein
LRQIPFRTLLVHFISDVPELFEGPNSPSRHSISSLFELITKRGVELSEHGRGHSHQHHKMSTSERSYDVRRIPVKYSEFAEPLRKRKVRHPGEDSIGKSQKRAKTILEYEESLYATVSLISELYQEEPDILTKIRTPEIIRNLLIIGRNARSNGGMLPIVYYWIREILRAKSEIPPEIQRIIDDNEMRDSIRIHRLIHMFQIWPLLFLNQVIEMFFSDPPISETLNQTVLTVIKEMSDNERREFLEAENERVLKSIVVFIPSPPEHITDRTFLNGHIMQLAFFIADPDKNKVVTEFMESSIWNLFIKSRLVVWKYIEQLFRGR